MQRFPFRFPRISLAFAVLALAATACDKQRPPGDDGGTPPGDGGEPPITRKAAVPADHALFDRFEGTGFDNACNADTDCLTGGCSGEVCSASREVVTTCEVLPVTLPQGTSCGCVQAQCIWWNPEGLTLPPVEAPERASCATILCDKPQVCLEYYGVAGPSGPRFASCEIPCGEGRAACPEDQACVTIADGPGQVCRPSALTE